MEDLDMELDWAQVDILTSTSPPLFNNLTYASEQLNAPTVSAGTVAATPNQAQSTDHAFNFSEDANSGNLPQLSVDDCYQLPQLPSNSALAPLPDEIQSSYYVPSMVGLNTEGAGSSVQGPIMTPVNYYNQFPLTQNNNFPLIHDLGQHNQQNTNNQQQSSQYPAFFQQNFQQNSVETLAVGNEATNSHFMTNQISPVFAHNNHAINPHSAWNSQRSLWMQDQGNQYNPLLQNTGFIQHNSFSLNRPSSLSSSFTSPSALNSANMGFSGTRPTEGPSGLLFNNQVSHISSLLRPERAQGTQLLQVPPFSVNTMTSQRADNGLTLPSSFRTQTSVPSLNMLNQSDRSLVTYGPYTNLQQSPSLNLQSPSLNLQSPSLNLQYPRIAGNALSTVLSVEQGQREPPRRGRPRKHFEPGEASSPYKRRKRGSSTRENVGRSSLSQGNQTAAGAVTDQNPPNASSSAAETASPFVNAMYDPAFERAGVPIDPLLRPEWCEEPCKVKEEILRETCLQVHISLPQFADDTMFFCKAADVKIILVRSCFYPYVSCLFSSLVAGWSSLSGSCFLFFSVGCMFYFLIILKAAFCQLVKAAAVCIFFAGKKA
ncbi:hypothetical protein VNO80_18549 [Phaseolus coccineus]|uniref:Uncharacterized protein n=1 Tax=Phaseolus coccineus TaxID=3886 RepID=A0AAN9MED0_PHACN